MNAGTSMGILNLDDRTAQLQLTQGTLGVRVRRLEPDQVFEVDTPNLAFTLRQPGAYRIAKWSPTAFPVQLRERSHLRANRRPTSTGVRCALRSSSPSCRRRRVASRPRLPRQRLPKPEC